MGRGGVVHSWPQAKGFLDSLAEEWATWKRHSSRKRQHYWGFFCLISDFRPMVSLLSHGGHWKGWGGGGVACPLSQGWTGWGPPGQPNSLPLEGWYHPAPVLKIVHQEEVASMLFFFVFPWVSSVNKLKHVWMLEWIIKSVSNIYWSPTESLGIRHSLVSSSATHDPRQVMEPQFLHA